MIQFEINLPVAMVIIACFKAMFDDSVWAGSIVLIKCVSELKTETGHSVVWSVVVGHSFCVACFAVECCVVVGAMVLVDNIVSLAFAVVVFLTDVSSLVTVANAVVEAISVISVNTIDNIFEMVTLTQLRS